MEAQGVCGFGEWKEHDSIVEEEEKSGEGTYLVARRVTVVWTTEGRDAKSIMLNGIPVLPDLMAPNDGSDFVKLTPAFGDVRSETKSDALVVSGWLHHRCRQRSGEDRR